MNDPNGLIEWRGRYHLFYQYNPNGPFPGTIHWGHAASRDLVHWEDLPIALTPTPEGPDAGGCWSGSAVDDAGTPTLVYTGVAPQRVCLARGSADLVNWVKHPGNPVIAGPPEAMAAATGGDFRDPFVWQEAGTWHLVIGCRVAGQGGAVLHYGSNDLVHWEYLGVLLQGDQAQCHPFQAGAVWECPSFVQVGEQHCLVVSPVSVSGHALYPIYFAGRFDGQHFEPTAQGILVHGASHYAPQVMRLADGRRVLIGWLREERPQAELNAAGWAGAMSLPMTLSALSGGGVGLAPVDELKALRRDPHRMADRSVAAGDLALLTGIRGRQLEIEAVFEAAPDADFGLTVCQSPDGREQTRVRYDGAHQQLSVEATGVSALAGPAGPERHAPVALDADGRLRLHLFLDGSVLEVFANTSTCLAARLYPTRGDSTGAGLFCMAGHARLHTLEAWVLEA
jgi:beta-fructofuranosidase